MIWVQAIVVELNVVILFEVNDFEYCTKRKRERVEGLWYIEALRLYSFEFAY